jgi:DNA-binding MarR family transcriptional regulator
VIYSLAQQVLFIYLYVVESADYVFLQNLTGLSWDNLATHLGKLEEVGYIIIHKGYKGKKPHTSISMTEEGRKAFREYKEKMQKILDELPD